MATYVSLHNRVYVGALDLSSLAESVDFGTLSATAVPFTNFGSGGFVEHKPGLKSGTFTVDFFQDFAADVADSVLGDALGTQYAVTASPNVSGTETVADPCYFSRGSLTGYMALSGRVGDAAKSQAVVPYDTAFVRGLVAHPKAARTTTGTGDAVALAGPTATQKLYAALHVTAYSGLTNVVFKVQSDDNSNFTSATDRITFTTVTGTGSQFASVAGAFDSETHHRVTWTVTGTGSVTFFAAVGAL